MTAIALLLLPTAVGAQERLSLRQAVDAAIAANPDLKASRAAREQRAAEADGARAGYLPRVDLAEGVQRGDNPVFVFSSRLAQRQFTAAGFAIDALNHPDAATNFRAAVAVNQPVYDPARLASIHAARVSADSASEQVREEASALTLAVTRAYGALLSASADRRAAEAAVDAAREDLARAERRRDVGLASEADVLSLAVHRAQMEERRIRAASGETIARAELNRLMGAPLDSPVTPEEPAPAAPTALAGIAEAEQEALQGRSAVKLADLGVAQADASRQAARAAFLPQVDAQGVVEWNGGTFADRASSWTVGLQLRWNVFAGLGDRARSAAAAQAAIRAEALRESTRSAVLLEVRTARAQLEAAVAREALGRAAVLQARESRRILRDRYDAGLAGVSDLLRAATALVDSESQRTSAAVDVMVSQAVLDRALGRQ